MLTKSQLLWRCRRGVRELDILMTRFVEQFYDQMSEQEQAQFEKLLDVQDPTIMDWIFERETPPDQPMQALIHKLQAVNAL